MSASRYTYLNFLDLSTPFKVENYHCYDGFFNIPFSSSFYDDIIISHGINISHEDIRDFFSSKDGKVSVTKMFTKIYLRPVKKTLKKHGLLNIARLRLLVNLKMLSKSKYIAVAKQLSKDTTDDDLIRLIKSLSS